MSRRSSPWIGVVPPRWRIQRGGRKIGVDLFLDLWQATTSDGRTRWNEPRMVYHGAVGLALGFGYTSENHKWRSNVSASVGLNRGRQDIAVGGGLSYMWGD